MTLPDDLVKAASDAVLAEWVLFRAPRSGGTELVRSEYEEVIRTAVAAVLRALRESEVVRQALIDAKLAGRHEAGEGYHFNTNELAAVKALAAIAKLADDA